MRALNTVFLYAVCTLFSSCAADAETLEFQLYSGNESLPPQYQNIEVIRGRIDKDKISTHFKQTQAGKTTKEKDAVFEGDEFKKWIKMVRNTKVVRNMQTGGSNFDVTLIDKKKNSVMGTPSNKAEWQEFRSAVLNNVAPPIRSVTESK